MNRTRGLVLALAAAAVRAFTLTPMMFARRVVAGRLPLRRTLATAVPLTELPGIKVETSSVAPAAWKGDLLTIPLFSAPKPEGGDEESKDEDAEAPVVLAPLTAEAEALDESLKGAISQLVESAEFEGKSGSSCSMFVAGGSKIALVGLGEAPKPDDEADKKAKALGASLGSAVASMAKGDAKGAASFGVVLPDACAPDAFASALMGGLYSDNRFRTGDSVVKAPKVAAVDLLSGGADGGGIAGALALLEGVNLCKDLVNAPPNVVNPKTLAEVASAVASECGLECRILERDEIEAKGMGCYLGVAQGSQPGDGDPRFIHLSYKPEGEVVKRVSLVGKGLTFDSGGYNLKAGAGSMIEMMKFDMGGSAAVLGAAKAIGLQKPEGVAVDFIVAACENMVSDRAMRPGDVLVASNGKKVEVINTDAEGRLTLADALVYAEALDPKPDAIIDIATLTGACIISLGDKWAGLWSSCDDLAGALAESSKRTGDKIWRMPLASEEYKELTKSKIADLTNVGPRGGGAITAALFLQEFVSAKTAWAHVDIAGPVWDAKQGGATGFGVKLLVDFATASGKPAPGDAE